VGSGADDRPRLPGKRGPPIQGSPLLREPDKDNSVREEGGRPDPRTRTPAFHWPPGCANGRKSPPGGVSSAILTKSAGLSSKFTFGEGMTWMGDICPTVPHARRSSLVHVVWVSSRRLSPNSAASSCASTSETLIPIESRRAGREHGYRPPPIRDERIHGRKRPIGPIGLGAAIDSASSVTRACKRVRSSASLLHH
jgi:hypothetical protein